MREELTSILFPLGVSIQGVILIGEMLLWVLQYLHCKHLFMEGLGQIKLIYLGGVLRGMTQIRHIFRKVAVMHTKIMLLYFVKVTGDVF